VVDVEELWLIEHEPDISDVDLRGVAVRVAVDDDWPIVAELIGERAVAAGRRRGDVCFLACRDGTAVGCGWMTIREYRLPKYGLHVVPRPGQAYHYGLYVAPGARRGGVAAALCVVPWQYAREHGRPVALGHISPRNAATPRIFVDRFGHRIRSRRRVLVLAGRFGFPLS
jgi:GNAT superfamily N-acetyltransferase